MKQLYKRVCPSVRRSLGPSVTLSLFGLLGATYGRVSGLVNQRQCLNFSINLTFFEDKIKKRIFSFQFFDASNFLQATDYTGFNDPNLFSQDGYKGSYAASLACISSLPRDQW